MNIQDFADLTDEQLDELLMAVIAERDLRRASDTLIGHLPETADEDVGDIPEWEQPTSAATAYPLGAIVKDSDGDLYQSRIPGNAHPLTHARSWRTIDAADAGAVGPNVVAQPETPPVEPAATFIPWQDGIDVEKGQIVAHAGKAWRALEAHTTSRMQEPGIGTQTMWEEN